LLKPYVGGQALTPARTWVRYGGEAAAPVTTDGRLPEASDLVAPGGAILSADKLRFYREGIVTLPKMSDASFRTDLLPRNDAGECTGDCRMFDALVKDPKAPTPPDVSHPSLRDWLAALPTGHGVAASFETKLWWSPGGATGAIDDRLRRAGFRTVAKGQKFVVKGSGGTPRR